MIKFDILVVSPFKSMLRIDCHSVITMYFEKTFLKLKVFDFRISRVKMKN